MINLFKRKKPLKIELGKVGLVVDTDQALESGITNEFNKKIVIHQHVRVFGNDIHWGKILEEIPYTEEQVRNLIEIRKIPIVPKKFSDKFKFEEFHPFGEVVND